MTETRLHVTCPRTPGFSQACREMLGWMAKEAGSSELAAVLKTAVVAFILIRTTERTLLGNETKWLATFLLRDATYLETMRANTPRLLAVLRPAYAEQSQIDLTAIKIDTTP